MGKQYPELAFAKAIGLILPPPDWMEAFRTLNEGQRAYFVHWMRSNPRWLPTTKMWMALVRRSRERRNQRRQLHFKPSKPPFPHKIRET